MERDAAHASVGDRRSRSWRWTTGLSICGCVIGSFFGFCILCELNRSEVETGGFLDGISRGLPMGALIGTLVGAVLGVRVDLRKGIGRLQYRLSDLFVATVVVAVLAALAARYVFCTLARW